MPFTPKFVDMVRNLTTSTGTGAVTLGSAVSGFTSLSAAVLAGEQFYYCIQGVDKPAERETGRGTMLANGTIAREVISGALTNFTTGTKTIALVTAAEWFTKIEAGGSGGGGASMAVTSLADLAALPTANGAAVTLTAPGREGLFVFSSANMAALVTADTRKGIYVAPAAATTGASGAWVRKYDGPVNVRWFGAVADFVTDDLPAFDAALALIKATVQFGVIVGGSLRVPAGKYYLSNTLNVHVPVNIIGDGSLQGAGGTVLRFGKNCNGVVFNKGNTHGDGLGTQGDSSGSRMEALQLWGGNVNVNGSGNVTNFGAGDSTTGNGVRIRATFVSLRDIFSAFWGGDGFNIISTAGAGGSNEGNANDFSLDFCQGIYNRGAGFVIAGSDSNAGTINTCSAISNGGGGFIEYSFLGNSYLQCHTRDNGHVDPTGSNGPVGTCLYGGTPYYVVAGQQVAAATTVPGTNAAVWAPALSAGASKPWVAGLTWVNPSPYGTNPANVNGRNVFTGCYAEGNQSPCQATFPSLFVGGLLDEVSVVGSATWLRGTAGGGISAGEFGSPGASGGSNFGSKDGSRIFSHSRGVSIANFRGLDSDPSGKKALQLELDNSYQALNIALENAHPHGFGAVEITRLFVGNATAHPSGGAWFSWLANLSDLDGRPVSAGAMFWHIDALPGEPGFYLCTTAGVGGAGAILTPLGPLDLAEASAAQIRAGTIANRFISPQKLFDAAAPVATADAATITIDGATGINFNITLGGNRTLANPTNMKPGQSGRVRVRQDATGGRTLVFGANWLFAGGDPALSTTANTIDVIAYFANAANEIEATIVKALS